MPKPNKLINEKSPYLIQHAYNPVEWYPWGDEAFQKAKDEDKPIFLSIGYSTCYWCHVMEREVFENESIAKEMNRMYVNIKVDREERPDVDRVYMSALQAMTGSGGWPMSMFLTPDLKPFYGATYVPPKTKYGLPGFEELITQLYEAWHSRRDEVLESGNKIIDHIREASQNITAAGELSKEMLLKGAQQFKNGFDDEYGGFGESPKFPRPPGINFLLRAYYRFEDSESLQIVIRTLLQMAKGGMYDHLGGGFHRYSVDRYWRVPHFEKMLYDQAQLAVNYLEAYQITGDKYFGDITRDVLAYVGRVMTDADGGFYSAEDAESVIDPAEPHEKEEGAFYVWSKSEIDTLLGDDAEIFNYFYGVNSHGNAPQGSDPHSVFVEKNILYKAHSISETSNKFERSTDEINNLLEDSKKILFDSREKRPQPHKDDKILTSWNGLMISAFAKAYGVFNEPVYLEKAQKAADFILGNLYNSAEKKLLHRWRDGEAKIDATLEDFSFFSQGLIDLYEASFDEKYLKLAVELTEVMINDFYDDAEGGFFDTSGKDKSILVRTKEDYDSAEPTGNAVAINNLLRLSALTGNTGWYDMAYKSVLAFSGKLKKMPYAMPQMLVALDSLLHKPKQIIIAGGDDETAYRMLREVQTRFMPDKVVVKIDPNDLANSITFASKVVQSSAETTAYVCENFACRLPVKTLEEFIELLD
ncbi:MAG TPA: thioredoxin domain-containing protein [Ignavibacteria bacterium]|nr:thioredoxin domain-containing protein [Ignavibacteria bacterium]HMQ98667.1 thioredoxin domain-containing protein [Ignavibacteria bacterium]